MQILIIKTGHTETFDPHLAPHEIVSLGDVLRTTVLLHLFKDDEVTWLTSPEARPLLENNPFISTLTTNYEDVGNKTFDLIINLELTAEALTLVQLKTFKKIVGFHHNQDLKTRTGNWSQKLYSLFEKEWKNEGYLLFPRELKESSHDLGLNWKVGPKWPSKSWPFSYWEEIQDRVKGEFAVSWQEGFENLPDYIAWIQSCKVLLTHDSLGLHIGLALGKKMVALFGPTLSREIPLTNTKVLSLSEDPTFSCPPCYQQQCHSKIHCVGSLSVDLVESHIRKSLREPDEQLTTG